MGNIFNFCSKGAFSGKEVPESEVLLLMDKLDKSDPQKRPRTVYDVRFERLLPFFYKYGKALKEVSRYRYLEETFFRVVTDIGFDQKWQQRLCSVEANKFMPQNPYFVRYPNLLFGYLQRYDLLPEIKKDLLADEKYRRVVALYEDVRGKLMV